MRGGVAAQVPRTACRSTAGRARAASTSCGSRSAAACARPRARCSPPWRPRPAGSSAPRSCRCARGAPAGRRAAPRTEAPGSARAKSSASTAPDASRRRRAQSSRRYRLAAMQCSYCACRELPTPADSRQALQRSASQWTSSSYLGSRGRPRCTVGARQNFCTGTSPSYHPSVQLVRRRFSSTRWL